MRKIQVIVAVLLLGCGGGGTTPHVNQNFDLSGGAQPDLSMPGGNMQDMSMTQPTDDLTMVNPGADMMCKAPSTLHPPKMGMPSIYCPFSGMNGGKNIYCQQGQQHCCESKTGACLPLSTACAAMEVDWQCQDPTDCGNGMKCCGTGNVMMGGPGCQNFATMFKGTHCAASCMANEITMCTSNGECANGTCLPFATRGAQVGACM